MNRYVLSGPAEERFIRAASIRSALGLIGGVAMVLLYNTPRSPRPLIGGQGTGKFWRGAGWFIVGNAVGGAVGMLLTPHGFDALATPSAPVALAPSGGQR